MEKSEIEEQGAQTVVDALEFVPGAWIESRGRKVKQFLSFRGQKYPYPEYAIDGVLFREFHEVPYFLSAGDIERVEVMRSGGAMLAGNAGLVGLINVVPKQYEGRETSVKMEYGSLGTAHARVSHGGRVGDFSYGLGLDGYRSDGPEDRHGEERMANYYAGLSWKPSDSLSMTTHLFHIGGSRGMVQALPPATRKLQTALEKFDPIQTSFRHAEYPVPAERAAVDASAARIQRPAQRRAMATTAVGDDRHARLGSRIDCRRDPVHCADRRECPEGWSQFQPLGRALREEVLRGPAL